MDIHISIPLSIKYKFILYILACQEYKKRRTDIENQALLKRETPNYYRAEFNLALTQFLKHGPDAESIAEAILFFCDELKTRINICQKRNQAIAQIFNEIYDSIRNLTSQDENKIDNIFSELDAFGKSQAISFFSNSPWRVTKHKINFYCCQNIYISYERDNKIAFVSFSFRDEIEGRKYENVIFVKFNISWGIVEFNIFPFLFTHEYISHIFSTDNALNPGFNDGWLMFCLEKYFYTHQRLLLMGKDISTGDIDLFHKKIIEISNINQNFEQSYFLAGKLFNFLNGENLSDRFFAYSFELAAYVGSDDWPTNFLIALNVELNSNPDKLLSEISIENSAKNLWDNYLFTEYLLVFQ